MRTRLCLLIFILLLLPAATFAQVKDFGEVTGPEFAITDSSASAVVLFDKGEVWFDQKFRCVFRRHVRIKVLNENGRDHAEVGISFNKDYDQRIRDIKAASYHKKDGSVVRTEMDGDDILEEHITEDIYRKKFIIPSAASGTIIEYEYEKMVGSPFLMPDWVFHDEIPVLHSSYEMRIPDHLKYKMIVTGFDPDVTKESERFVDSRTGMVTTVTKSNMPAVDEIPFVNTRKDFLTKLLVQLEKVNLPGYGQEVFLKDWEEVTKEIRLHPEAGKQRPDGAIKDAVESIIAGKETEIEKTEAIYRFVGSQMLWDGSYGFTTDKGIRDAFKERSGNSADINILLFEMLREAGLDARFALVSTRDNGVALPYYPIVNQFNHIAVAVIIGESALILDGTEGERPLGLIPQKILYRNILMFNEDNHRWLYTRALSDTKERRILNYSITDEGKMKGEYSKIMSGYAAQRARSAIRKEDPETYLEDLYDSEQLTFTDDTVSNLEEDNKQFKLLANFEYEVNSMAGSDSLIYLNPWAFLKTESHPLTEKDRDFPVHFPYPFNTQTVINIEVPDGFSTEELPEPVSIKLDEGGGHLLLTVNAYPGFISVSSSLRIAKETYPVAEYGKLQSLFNEMVQVNNTPIVLKKSGT